MVKKGEVSVPKKEKNTVKKTSAKENCTNLEVETKNDLPKEPISFKPKNINKKYISFNTRFIMSFLVFLILLSSALLLIITSLSKINEQSINYQEKSNVNYDVLLKDNSLYDKTYFVDKDKPHIYIYHH